MKKCWIIPLLSLTCFVLEQKKYKHLYLTTCRGVLVDSQTVNSEVVFDVQVMAGQVITYRPRIIPGDEIIHGDVLGIVDSPSEAVQKSTSTKGGKLP